MIERSAVIHRPIDQFAYPIAKDLLHLMIKTKKGNVSACHVIHGDQYEWKEHTWVMMTTPMISNGSDGLYDYWHVDIKSPTKRIRYGFVLFGSEEIITYTEKGFFSESPKDPSYYFCFPFIHVSEVKCAPSWVKEIIWYQIFPDRFSNGNPALNPVDTKPWGSEQPTATNYFGGDFEGIIQKLDYLEELGITGIYLTPIFKAYSNHKYDSIDYFEIDPQFGDKAIFKQLVDKCHEKGIRVMLDAVFNHCGYYFHPFQDVLVNCENSSFKDWFHINSFPLQGGERPNYATFSFVETMPKFNTQNEDVKNYLLEVGRYWVREFNIDGWRLDVANEIDHSFWRDFRSAVKAIKPDIFILGEIWHDSLPWLRGDQFDSVMNYPFQTHALNLFAYEHISPQEFIEKMTEVIQQYPFPVNETLFNLVGSHDTPRLLTECGEDIKKAKLIYTFLLTFIGTPCLYYGDEIGITGGMDPGCRKCMPWEKNKHNVELFNYIKRLISLRKQEPLLSNTGTFQFLHLEQGVAFIKSGNHRKCLIILNPSHQELTFTIPFPLKGKKVTDLLAEKDYIMEHDHLAAIIKPYDATILQFSL